MDELKPSPEAAGNKSARQRTLAGSMWVTIPGTLLLLGAATLMLPPLAVADAPAARLAFALRWLPVALLPYAATCLHILLARFLEGAHNPLLGSESERLKIHCRVMQNTLEQLVWFTLCVLALAAGTAPLRLVPMACVLFAAARFIYWWGYLRRSTLGRAPGVQMTFTLNVALLAMALAQLLRT
ncbi:MAPEG family protein [Aquabacterium humicola]|uniref:MAPEG family protein n=1 Tax=Aquabacterium humicola TaxID=3237377 RepID=UPI002543A2C7|nr:MAPEG family protein [Rubrivivax pictus]